MSRGKGIVDVIRLGRLRWASQGAKMSNIEGVQKDNRRVGLLRNRHMRKETDEGSQGYQLFVEDLSEYKN